MRVAEMNWKDIEVAARRDRRCCLPIGSVEQHAQLSVCTDAILAERISCEAAAPLDIPVLPVMPFGLAPYFTAYPGTISLRLTTLLAVIRDVISSLHDSGFTHICVVSGHGGNAPVAALLHELMAEAPELCLKYHEWWRAPRTAAAAAAISASASHANWFENFPWTRLAHAAAPPGEKPAVDRPALAVSAPQAVRQLLGDGSYGGPWQQPDEVMLKIWETGVEETRQALQGPWASEFGSHEG